MSGIFGLVSKKKCAGMLLYRTDHNSPMGIGVINDTDLQLLITGSAPGNFAVPTEIYSFLNLAFQIKKYLTSGEIVLIGESGPEEKSIGKSMN
jgi:hypothetical protein